jgi:hemerythrin
MTEDYEWTDSYRLGIPGVDQEHRTFFALLTAIQLSVEEQDGLGAREALRNLRLYAENHFAHEESYLRALGYPALPGHQAEHAEFMRDVTVLEATPEIPTAVAIDLARQWIARHILGSDRRYGRWIEEAGAAPKVFYPTQA